MKSVIILSLVIALVYFITLNRRISEMFEDIPSVTPVFSNDFVLYTSFKFQDITIYVWQLNNTNDATRLGQFITTSKDKPNNTIPILNTLISNGKYPVKYSKIWENKDKSLVLWRPIAPNGYKVLSDVFTSSDVVPGFDAIVCVPEQNLSKIDKKHKKILEIHNPTLSIWKSGNHQGFIGNGTIYDPVLIPSYNLPNYLMQNTLQVKLTTS